MVLDSPTPMARPATTDSDEECYSNSADRNPLPTVPAPDPESSSDSDMPHAEFSADSELPRVPQSPARRRCGRKGTGQLRCCSFCDSLQQSVRDLESLVAQLQDQLDELQRRKVEEIGIEPTLLPWRGVLCHLMLRCPRTPTPWTKTLKTLAPNPDHRAMRVRQPDLLRSRLRSQLHSLLRSALRSPSPPSWS